MAVFVVFKMEVSAPGGVDQHFNLAYTRVYIRNPLIAHYCLPGFSFIFFPLILYDLECHGRTI